MSRVARALLIAFGLCLLPAAHAATAPLVVQRCGNAASNSGVTASAFTCNLTNTTSGNTIIMEYAGSMTGSTISATETLTCPAGSTIQHSYAAARQTGLCYVVTASSHAVFSVTVTATGGLTEIMQMVVKEIQGLGAVDSGSATSVAGTTMSVTTANPNEWLESMCSDFVNDFVPGTGFTQLEWLSNTTYPTQSYKGLTQKQITTTAGSYTTACTFTNSLGLPEVVALAFQQSSPPAVPAVNILQSCFTFGNSSGANVCALHNTASGSKIVIGALGFISGSFPVIVGTCTETCLFPSSAKAQVAVSGSNYTLNAGYGDTTTTHAIYQVSVGNTGGGGGLQMIFAYEVAGLNTGIDSGSEAGANATSVSYTTAAANEWTFSVATDNGSNNMTPGSSFLQWGQTFQASTNTPASMQQGLAMAKVTAASGSNTTSYALTGSTTPLISTISFGQTVQPLNARHSQAF